MMKRFSSYMSKLVAKRYPKEDAISIADLKARHEQKKEMSYASAKTRALIRNGAAGRRAPYRHTRGSTVSGSAYGTSGGTVGSYPPSSYSSARTYPVQQTKIYSPYTSEVIIDCNHGGGWLEDMSRNYRSCVRCGMEIICQ